MVKKVISDTPITVEDIIGSEKPKEEAKEETPQEVVHQKETPQVVSPPLPSATPILPGGPTSPAGGFNGYVDDRIIPDAGLPTEAVSGMLDLSPNGHGYLRPKGMPSANDVYISASQIRRFQLRPGDIIGGQARRPKENERYWGLLKVENINGELAEKVGMRPYFDDLTPIFPDEQLRLEIDKEVLSTRMIETRI